VTLNSLTASARDRVFAALIHAEQERVGAGLIDSSIGWGFPFSCCEAAKNEILGGLNYSHSPTLLITASVKILVLPPIRGSIIDPLECSLRILVSYEFEDHLPMGRGP